MKEKRKHREAFEHFYIKLNEGNTVTQSVFSVVDTFGMTKSTVWRWYKEFNWNDKIAVRDINIQNSLEEKINTTIIDNKAKYLGIIHFSLNKYVKEVNNKTREPIPIENSRDLERLIKTSLLIQNQPTDISEQKGSMKHEYSGKIETETVFTRVDKLLKYLEVSNDTDDDQKPPK